MVKGKQGFVYPQHAPRGDTRIALLLLQMQAVGVVWGSVREMVQVMVTCVSSAGDQICVRGLGTVKQHKAPTRTTQQPHRSRPVSLTEQELLAFNVALAAPSRAGVV